MYFSRARLNISQLPLAMQLKLPEFSGYALHQWLWQLFPEQDKRHFLFRTEHHHNILAVYLLSAQPPIAEHNLFQIETKPFSPRLVVGLGFSYSLRVNPVVCRDNKRYDILMDVKHKAKQQQIDTKQIKLLQYQAAENWLTKQGDKRGFSIEKCRGGSCQVMAYQQHQFKKPNTQQWIKFSSIDYQGHLWVTNTELFLQTLMSGLGKSKGFGCGMLMIKRA